MSHLPLLQSKISPTLIQQLLVVIAASAVMYQGFKFERPESTDASRGSAGARWHAGRGKSLMDMYLCAGIVFAIVTYANHTWTWGLAAIASITGAVFLLAIAISDLRTMLVSDALTLPPIVIGAVLMPAAAGFRQTSIRVLTGVGAAIALWALGKLVHRLKSGGGDNTQASRSTMIDGAHSPLAAPFPGDLDQYTAREIPPYDEPDNAIGEADLLMVVLLIIWLGAMGAYVAIIGAAVIALAVALIKVLVTRRSPGHVPFCFYMGTAAVAILLIPSGKSPVALDTLPIALSASSGLGAQPLIHATTRGR